MALKATRALQSINSTGTFSIPSATLQSGPAFGPALLASLVRSCSPSLAQVFHDPFLPLGVCIWNARRRSHRQRNHHPKFLGNVCEDATNGNNAKAREIKPTDLLLFMESLRQS